MTTPDTTRTAPDAAEAHVVDVDLATPVQNLRRVGDDGTSAPRVWALVRLHGEPLGALTLSVPPDGLSGPEVERLLLERFAAELADRGVAPDGGAATVPGTPFSRAHRVFLAEAPRCSVVVCTRERPAELARCLESLVGQDHPDFAVWVVDNAPTTSSTRDVVTSFADRLDVRYVLEERPGLSRARNAALRQQLEGDVVCWIDDDEIADELWVGEILRAFSTHPEAVAASGVVVPAELRTRAQIWFEQFGGHSKGRGFTPDVFSPRTRHRQDPLYPLPPFGVGANMAFRTEVLRRLGGFDEALGAGTPSQGSEDTKMFTDILISGGTSVYQPTAITRHYHRRDLEGLRRQMRGYGSGLTGFYLATVLARPTTIVDLLRLAPRALRDQFSSRSIKVATIEADFPRELLALNRRGLLAGPWLYLVGRRRNRPPSRRTPR